MLQGSIDYASSALPKGPLLPGWIDGGSMQALHRHFFLKKIGGPTAKRLPPKRQSCWSETHPPTHPPKH